MKNNIQYIEKPNYSNEVNIAIENHIDARIQNELIKNGNDEVFHEIRNYKDDKKNELKEFNDYFENNKGNIIEEKNFEEGYNSRTGSIESFDTLLNEYKLNTENNIEEDNFNKLSENAKNELNTLDKLNINQFESSLLLDDYPEVENVLKNIDEDIQKLGQIEQGDLRNITISINNIETSYDVINKNSLNKETIISRDLINNEQNIEKPAWGFEEENQKNNLNQNNKDIEDITSTDLQKLKSVEVEKNVIGLLPKEQQENKFKETLSRLEKNKSSLKDNLKNYMSNEKIDNAINSVKQHFENIKVKTEDIQQTFKDLGSWNTENKFIKNIDNVVDKVKGIAQKNENKLDINDPDLFKKLETKFKESNSFIENIEKTNNIDNQLSNERLKFHENTLKIINPEMESTTNNITSSLSDLSKEDKLNLYNYSKDINSLNLGKNFTEPENIKTAIESQKLINSIENEFGKSTVDESRKEYLVSNTAKPTVNNNFNDNPTLKNFTNNANQFITNIDKNDLKSYQQNCNVEVSKINNNQKSNTLKNNDLLQKYNKQNEPKQQQSNTQEEEQKNEKSIKKGRTHSM